MIAHVARHEMGIVSKPREIIFIGAQDIPSRATRTIITKHRVRFRAAIGLTITPPVRDRQHAPGARCKAAPFTRHVRNKAHRHILHWLPSTRPFVKLCRRLLATGTMATSSCCSSQWRRASKSARATKIDILYSGTQSSRAWYIVCEHPRHHD